ncbi:MAG: DUF7408 domain-containing protein, partial [Halobacteriota archaeon]
NIEAREATADEAGDAVAEVRQTHSRGDLESAVSQAASLVGDSGRVVVYSDFAGDSDWSQVVEEARSRGVAVELEQFADGGDENVGIVDKSFEEDRVTVTVQSFATSLQDRELSLGDESHEFSIRPGERRSFSFSVPEEGGVAKLSPGDDFAVDDEAYVARYSDGVDALLVSSEEDTAVERGLDSLPNVDLSVDTPPVGSVSDDVDVVVYGEVDASRAVSRTARSARDLTEEGGGAIVTAHDELPDAQDTLSDVMLVDVDGFVEGGEVEVTSNRSLVADVDHDFPAAPEVLDANVTAGDSLLEAGDQPLLVDAEVGDGRLVYYGYVEGATDFDSSYFYPLFWRDLVHHAAGRQPLPAANKRTGATVDVGDQADVPWGSDSGDVVMDEIGFYETSNDVYSASLLDPGESAVEASDVDGSRMAEAAERSQETRNPFDFTPLIIVLALGVIGSELLLLRRRGDL